MNMPTRHASALWNGSLQQGTGMMSTGSGVLKAPFDTGSRLGDKGGTNPDELIGAAHAGCFSMALSMLLGEIGIDNPEINSDADVTIEQTDGGLAITGIALRTRVKAKGISEDEFQDVAKAAKDNCPVSKALAGTKITLSAELETAA
ncbi:OsmC family peroxiredoxin [bacterium]|nr:OsmC family peroxiredoxin [bacterium]